MRNLAFLLLGLLSFEAYGGFSTPVPFPLGTVGNPYTKVSGNTSALNVPSFTNGAYQPGTGPGQVVGNTNVFTGQPAYAIPLATLKIRSLAFPLTAFYGGPVAPVLNNNNQRAPTGWLGMGWRLSLPFVAVNHKGTFTDADDLYFCDLGPYGGGQIIRNPATKEYFVVTDPTIVVKAFKNATAGSPLNGQIDGWTFTLANGTTLYLGQTDGVVSNSERHVYASGPNVVWSPYAAASQVPFIYRWDIWKITDKQGVDAILFDHQKFLNTANTGVTQESYPQRIKTVDIEGRTIESWEFTLAPKASNESVLGGIGMDDRLFETHYLSEMSHYQEGNLEGKYGFFYATVTGASSVKRLLTRVSLNEPSINTALNPGARLKERRNWVFEYDAAKDYLLSKVTRPDKGEDRYAYAPIQADSYLKQDPTVYRMKDVTGAEVALPAKSQRLLMRNLSFCDERFCYLVVKDGYEWDGTKVEVVPHRGGYFDRKNILRLAGSIIDPANRKAGAQSIRLIPRAEDFLLADQYESRVLIYRWNGISFSHTAVLNKDSLFFGGQTGSSAGIEVYSGPNYFLVWKKGTVINGVQKDDKSRVYVYLKDPSTDTYNELSGSCQIDNPTYGSTQVKAAGDPCMIFNGDASKHDELTLSVAGPTFTVVHRPSRTLYVYTLNKAGTGFDNVSGAIPRFNTAMQEAAVPNRWAVVAASGSSTTYLPEEVIPGPECLIIKSTYANLTTHFPSILTYGVRLDFLHFDGQRFNLAGSEDWGTGSAPQAVNRQVWSAGDYVLTANLTAHSLMFWRKFKTFGAAPRVVYDSVRVRSDVPFDGDADLLVNTHPNGFSIEYWNNGSIPGGFPDGVPQKEGTPANYKVYLYKVENSFPYALPASAFSDRFGRKLTNISFSYSDNMVTGTSLRRSSDNAICSANDVCSAEIYTGLLNTYPSSASLAPITAVAGVPFNQQFYVDKWSNMAMNASGRLGMLSVLDTISKRILYQTYAFNGSNYAEPAAYPYVVSKTTTTAGLDEQARNQKTLSYDYNVPGNVKLLHRQSLSLQLSKCKITQAGVGGTSVNHRLDYPDGNPAVEELLSGRPDQTAVLNSAGANISSVATEFSAPYNRTLSPRPWPPSLTVTRPSKVTEKIYDPRGNAMASVRSFYRYDDDAGQPCYVLKPIRTGSDYVLDQTLFNSFHLPSQVITYRLPSMPVLDASAPTASPFSNANAVSSSKTVWNPDYRIVEDSLWRDTDGSLGPAQLASGTAPAYRLDEGWVSGGRVVAFNRFGQPLQSLFIKEDRSNQQTYTSYFYEGNRSDLVGQINNASHSRCGVLMAEDGVFSSIATHDLEGRWQRNGSVNVKGPAHTGRYCIKVTDNLGPSRKFYLDNNAAEKYGFEASAWVWAPGQVQPRLIVEMHAASGALVASFDGSYAESARRHGGWQRVRFLLDYPTIAAYGLFQGADADYLQVYVGTGAPSGDPNRILYVDDIVCRPTNTTFSLTAYDHRGLPTATIDNSHLTRFIDRNSSGAATGTRNPNYLLFGQNGTNLMGENP